jgi:hypothetical protein
MTVISLHDCDNTLTHYQYSTTGTMPGIMKLQIVLLSGFAAICEPLVRRISLIGMQSLTLGGKCGGM